MELMYVNKLFNECYRLYKQYAGGMKGDDFTDIARKGAAIAGRYSAMGGAGLASDMVAAVYNELARVYHEGE